MRRRQGRGCSIPELAIAALVLGIAFAPVLGLFGAGVRVTRSTLDEVFATSFASDALEQIETAGVSSLPAEATLSTADGSLADGAPVPGTGDLLFHLAAVPDGVVVALTISRPCRGLRKVGITARRSAPGAPPLWVRLDALVEGEEP